MVTINRIELENLRFECRRKAAELDLRLGWQKAVARRLGINRNQLSMALTGYRRRPRDMEILTAVKNFLESSSFSIAHDGERLQGQKTPPDTPAAVPNQG